MADFTFIWTAEGWLCVVAVINLFSRKVVGWSMSETTTAQLFTNAPIIAISQRGKPMPCSITQTRTASIPVSNPVD